MKNTIVSLLLVSMICSLSWADDERLVAHYSFDQEAGNQAKDGSGRGNHGEIHGAAFVTSPKGQLLRK